jgi:predicted esterase
MRSDVVTLWQSDKFAEAFDILRKEAPAYPDRHHDTLYFSMCLNSRMGNVDAAVEYFREAIEDVGHWYGESQLLESDDDLTNIWDHAEFQRLRSISLARCADAETAAKPLRLIEMPSQTDGALPLVLALHGNTGNAETTFGRWQPIVEDGYLLVALQSTQLSGPNAFVWNDFQKAKDELIEHYAALTSEYNIDTDRVVIGGFSMGGGFALWAAIHDVIPVSGYIGIGPYIADPESWQSRVGEKKNSGFRSYILVGDQDVGCLPGSQQTKKFMDDAGVACEFELREGLAHEVPSDFGETAKRALHFVLNQQTV